MDAVRARDWDRAAAEVSGARPAVAAVVTWSRLRAGDGSFEDYLGFIRQYPDWPGMSGLRGRGEPAIPADAAPSDVLDYFGDTDPKTGDGVLRLTAALTAEGRAADAEALAVRAWTTMPLGPLAESTLLAIYGPALAGHQIERMDAMLWQGALSAAERQRPRVPEGWRRLYDARSALRLDAPGVDFRIADVPPALAGDPGLAWERMEWRARRGRTDDMIALMLDRSTRADRLGRPEAWAGRRRELVYDLVQEGDPRRAYALAAHHRLTSGPDYADLEWLSGYLALRFLDDPETALGHFQNFRAAVGTPISLGRAGYWEGRALEALGRESEAHTAYVFGAEYQTSFYGQLAAERAGLPMDPLMAGTEVFAIPPHPAFARSSVFAAGLALAEAGEPELAARFFAHLAESLTRDEIGQMLEVTEALGSPYIQLQIAKRAAQAGVMLHRAYFPLFALSVEGVADVSPELALSIARRESEFNGRVISAAGARGLMQVMPATAQHMAERTAQPFSVDRLTADPAYNALLGTAYLQDLRNRFGAATVLVVAGYNAGPGRPQRWLATIGDPRGARMDPVDWIEMIPFDETRNYVMRVTESLAPYRARLAGKPVPLTLSEELAAPAWDGAPAPGRRPAATSVTPPVVPVTRAATP